MMNTNNRSVSLKSSFLSRYHRKSVLHSSMSNKISNKKKRPSTWTCHQGLSLSRRYTISPRVSRWCSQHDKSKQRRFIKGSSSKSSSMMLYPPESEEDQPFDTKRQTMATISTNTNSDTTTLNHPANTSKMHYLPSSPPASAVFHTQSMLFLFGFLFFPCWWVGGYYLKVELEHHPVALATLAAAQQNQLDAEEKQVITVHPSLLANGKTSSRLFWIPPPLAQQQQQQDTKPLFHKWNRAMSLVSVGLSICIIGLLIWYAVAY